MSGSSKVSKNGKKKIRVYDTTLRDGEQAPGFAMRGDEKLRLAEMLRHLGVDVIEAGFPMASPDEFDGVSRIARSIAEVQISALARARQEDIERAAEALRHAAHPRIHLFIGTSDVHIEHQLESDRESVIERSVKAVRLALAHVDNVQFSAMDGTRSDREYLARLLETVIAAGATTVNVSDTVGYALPGEIYDLFKYLRENVRNIAKVDLSVHCHDDLGLATANTLAAVRAGVDQVECTVNGIGERAGNAALEEVIMAIRTRGDNIPVCTDIRTEFLTAASRLLSEITGVAVPPNKAIVGGNAFAHKAGIHQDGILKFPGTYEIMDPREVGLLEGTSLILGTHSGKRGIAHRLKGMGCELRGSELDRFVRFFKANTDVKKQIDDNELGTIIAAYNDLYRGSSKCEGSPCM